MTPTRRQFLKLTEVFLPVARSVGASHAAAFDHFQAVWSGLSTRFSALALLGMTAVIQVFVYPDAYPTHAVWAAVLLYLMAHGPENISVYALIRYPVRR